MNEQDRKARIKATFNTVAAGYDSRALRFFSESAKYMAACLSLNGNEHVLDVATGTGIVAFLLASQLPNGQVTAIDLSEGMLEQARMKAESQNIGNVNLLEMDMQALELPDDHFDAATCAFGIFFVEDMERQLKHMSDKIKSGGKIIISAFCEDAFIPLAELYCNLIQKYGIKRPSFLWKRIGTKDKCASLFERVGLTDIRIVKKDIGYYLKSAEEWWSVIWNAGFRAYLGGLSLSDLDKFRKEHLEEIEKLFAENRIWLNVKVLYTIGTRS